ncbi:SCO2522 family protein [Nocardia vaccinii]|uniref:SCO2522 family protein n=1 Tax=Nocardia vaccinii TaxID=1822 RepID=UPI000831318A|nr:SCO2522 family protein [Nocardia vaccinii]
MVDGYSEATEHPKITPVPLSHLSIEVGHFKLRTIAEDPEALRSEFRRIKPLVEAFSESARIQYGPGARISTCYLIDDYFQGDDVRSRARDSDSPEPDPARSADHTPQKILSQLLAAAEECGLKIDYLARESACAQTSEFVGGVPLGEPIPLAEMVAACIVPEPAPDDTGGRPPTAESGWLCNGRRSSAAEPTQAMRERTYRSPQVHSANEHTIFIDIELWSKTEDGRTRWSCPFLAAIWHLLRLGMLRYHGAAVVDPQPHDAQWPDRWQDLPAIVRLYPGAEPFAAYRTLSMLPKRYIEIEHAVRVILDHLDLDENVFGQVVAAGEAEGIEVSAKISERLAHLLLDGS